MVGIKRFNWLPQKSTWQDLQQRRAQRAVMVQDMQNRANATNLALSNAFANRISGAANNAAQAALTRIQNAAKAANQKNIDAIDSAQAVLDQTQAAVAAASPTTTGILDTTV